MQQKKYVAYLKDITQDKQYRRLNPQTGTYLKRGEAVPEFVDRDIPNLQAYFTRVSAINQKLRFQIRDLQTGAVVWQT